MSTSKAKRVQESTVTPVTAAPTPEVKAGDLTPTELQVAFLVATGRPEELVRTKTRKECSAKIAEIIAHRRRQGMLAPTDAQLAYLERAGYLRSVMSERTRGFCRSLIFKVKKERGELAGRAS